MTTRNVMVRRAGFEPASPIRTVVSRTTASANSATDTHRLCLCLAEVKPKLLKIEG